MIGNLSKMALIAAVLGAARSRTEDLGEAFFALVKEGKSVATIVASQLASVLAAWPAASTTAAEPLDRKAAAS